MTTARKPAAGKAAATTRARKAGEASVDAIKLLMQDHKEVKALFRQYDKLAKGDGDDEEKQQIAEDICTQLTAHAMAEEEIFYPAARAALGKDADLVDEADVEHAGAKELIAQIQASSPGQDDHYDAKVKVLGEYIDHHVKEEEGEMFPKVRKTAVDLEALGADIAARKEELLAELGAVEA